MSSAVVSANTTLCSPRNNGTKEPENRVETAQLIRSPIPELPPNHVLIRVDKFGFSANNVTYEALGEHPYFRYFDFHAAPDSRYGIVPVWGFGTVVGCTLTQGSLKHGEKVYGYFSPTKYLLVPVEEGRAGKHSFYVSRPQFPSDRRPYNQIIRCDADPQYTPTPEGEDLTMIYRPLFWTAYWCEDWLYSGGYQGGVSGIVISSASAKTAYCLAYLIGKRIRKEGIKMEVVGLTSTRNVGFTTGLGLYDEVVEYGKIGEYFGRRKIGERWLYIDVAGNEELNVKIKDWIGQRLVAYVLLGLTSLSPGTGFKKESSDKEVLFFMPEWLELRRSQLSVEEISKMQNEAWVELMGVCRGWVKLERVYGANEVLLAYKRTLKDGFPAAKGYVWSMWDTVSPKL